MRIENDDFYGGIKIIDEDNVYHIHAEIGYKYDNGHGGGAYASDVNLRVWKEGDESP